MNISRQLKDIQHQADRLLNGQPQMEDIIQFDKYNEEMKMFLIGHFEEEELINRVQKIPIVLEEEPTETVSRNILSAILLFLVSWAVTYFQERQKIDNALSRIHEAKGNYASIEFLTRNL